MQLIALGANQAGPCGGPRDTLEAAIGRIGAAGLAVARRSPWYRTPAFPPGSGEDFVNAVIRVETAPEPAETLALLQSVESALGRERRVRWGPRCCDLDLLASDDRVVPDAETQTAWRILAPAAQSERVPDALILPHPRLQDRAFVLVPLCDVAPEWRHPLLDRTAAELLAGLPAAEVAAIKRL